MTKLIRTVPGIRVRTAQVGFRRGGREWSGVMEVAVSEFTRAQLEQICTEPLLVVEDIDIDLEQATDADNEAVGDSVGADLSAQAVEAGGGTDNEFLLSVASNTGSDPKFIAATDFEHDGAVIKEGDALGNFPLDVLMSWCEAGLAEPVPAEPASQSACTDGLDSLKITAAANLDAETAAKPAKKPAK